MNMSPGPGGAEKESQVSDENASDVENMSSSSSIRADSQDGDEATDMNEHEDASQSDKEDSDEEDDAKMSSQEDDDEEDDENENESQDDDEASQSDEEDQKMPAMSKNEKDSSDDSDSEQEDEEEENEENSQSEVPTDEFGRPLSAYEIMRLERIKRNQSYLARLGLEKEGKTSSLLAPHKEKMKKKKPKKKKETIVLPRRSSVGRRTKAKAIDYKEKSVKSKDDLLPAAERKKEPKKEKARKTKEHLPLYLYEEFRNMETTRNRNLRTCEKLSRAAEKEVRIATNQLERLQAKEKRVMEKLTRDEIAPMVNQIDKRRKDIIKTLRKIDGLMEKEMTLDEKQQKAEETLAQVQEKFPKLLQDAKESLGQTLLERLPPLSQQASNSKKLKITIKKKKKKGDFEEEKKNTEEDNSSKLSLPDGIDLEEIRKAEEAIKVRVQKTRNVGGPVTKDLANSVLRKWLDVDTAVAANSVEYLPQVGDVVLYYPCAHYDFLRRYPDIRCKKNRLTLRRTLWERALDERKEQEKPKPKPKEDEENQDGEAKGKRKKQENAKPWWTINWMSTIQRGAGRYPILCKVEKAYAEFPYDEDSQTEIRRFQNDSNRMKNGKPVNVKRRKEKDTSKRLKPEKNKKQMPLQVTLRPLTTVIPPSMANGELELAPPPVFSVLMFPSEKNSFLVPFIFAYRSSLNLTTNNEIKVGKCDGSVKKAKLLNTNLDGTGDADSIVASFLSIIEQFDNVDITALQKIDYLISEAYADTNCKYPLPEVELRAALQSILFQYHTRKNDLKQVADDDNEDDKIDAELKPDLFVQELVDLVQNSFPRWENANVQYEGVDAVEQNVSPWYISPIVKESGNDDAINAALAPSVLLSPERITSGGFVHQIDEQMRVQLESVLRYITNYDERSYVFYPPITDAIAPDYSRFVPTPICFKTILKRLRPHKLKFNKFATKTREDDLEDLGYSSGNVCYYRNIESLQSDISDIFQNCIMYNAPNSEIVLAAFHITKFTNLAIEKVADNVRKEQEHRRKLEIKQIKNAKLVAQGELLTNRKKTSIPPNEVELFGELYSKPLDRAWIESAKWIPQAGDKIVYNTMRHGKFIHGHLESLSAKQRALASVFPPTKKRLKKLSSQAKDKEDENGEESENISQNFFGTVVWTRTVFPNNESGHTDDVTSPLLALGIKFHYKWLHKNIQVVYWRPCSIDGSSCDNCGLSSNQSFIVPATRVKKDEILPPYPISLLDYIHMANSSLDEEKLSKCLRAVQRRLIENEQVDIFKCRSDFLPKDRVEIKDIPSQFRHIFNEQEAKGEVSESTVSDAEKTTLIQRSFLPPWSLPFNDKKKSTKSQKEEVNETTELQFHETLVVDTNRSLMAILDRLEKGYYRSLDAVVNDVREIFCSNLLYTIKDRVKKKKLAASSEELIFRAAVECCGVDIESFLKGESSCGSTDSEKTSDRNESGDSVEAKAESPVKTVKIDKLNIQEKKVLTDIQEIVKLFAVAMVSCFDPNTTEIALGVDKVESKVGALSEEQELAKYNLNLMLKSLEPDKQKFRKKTLTWRDESPTVEVFVKEPGTKKVAAVSEETEFDFSNPITITPEDIASNKFLKKALKCKSVKMKSCRSVVVKVRTMKKTLSRPINLQASDMISISTFKKVAKVLKKGKAPAQINVVVTSEYMDLTTLEHPTNDAPEVKEDENNTEAAEVSIESEKETDDTTLVDFNKTIKFLPTDYYNNTPLCRALFCRSKRRQVCARCLISKKGLFTCRVRSAHSNLDPTWIEYFKQNGGIDSILAVLDPDYKPPLPKLEESLTNDEDDMDEDGTTVVSEQATEKDSIKELLEEATANLLKANETAKTVKVLLARANAVMKTPILLSDKFMHATFKVDPSDGHFEICHKCGLGGDVICCESCPMVSHPKCAGMDEIPNEDWHCFKCTSKKKRGEPISSEAADSNSNADEDLAADMDDDEFDQKMENVSNVLDDLKQSRQKPVVIPIGTKLLKDFDGDDYEGEVIAVPSEDSEYYKIQYEDGDEEDLTLEEIQPLIEAYKQMQKEQEAEEEEIVEDIPRKRGRPRKIASPGSEEPKRRGRPRKSDVQGRYSMEPKRGRGRPRKEETSFEPKRGRGRPRKEDTSIEPKRGRGRPRKEDASIEPKRGRGRPRKEDTSMEPKRGRGRPRKEESLEESSPKRARGRPRKQEAEPEISPKPRKRGRSSRGVVESSPEVEPTKKRGRGRPRKSLDSSPLLDDGEQDDRATKKRGRGRPRKTDIVQSPLNEVESQNGKRKRGRRRNAEVETEAEENIVVTEPPVKKRRGRPPKNASLAVEENIEASNGKSDKKNDSQQLVEEHILDILPENIPKPGHVDKDLTYYCTKENDTTVKLASLIGCESWVDIAYLPENLERFPTLHDKKIKFRKGTLLRIAECEFSQKKAAKLI